MQTNHTVQRIREHALKNPDSTAIITGDTFLSYRDLWEQIQSVAHALANVTSAGERILCCLPNSLAYIQLLYACYFIGRTFVGIHPETKLDTLLGYISDCEPSLLVQDKDSVAGEGVSPKLGDSYEQLNNRIWSSHTISEIADRPRAAFIASPETTSGASNGQRARSAADLAKLVYTSGTTGHPKAVMLSHLNLSSNASAIASYLQLSRADRGFCALPLTYAYGNSILDSHLWAGASVVLEQPISFGQKIVERVKDVEATGFAGVATTYALLLRNDMLSRVALPKLRYVTQAGSHMPSNEIERLRANLPTHTAIYVMYGQTEATSRLTYLPPEKLAEKAGSAGIPINDTQIQIWGEEGAELSPLLKGDIVAKGPSIMMGYWKNAPLTIETITPAGWLHTGDKGYLDEEGYLYIVGRTSDIIKSGAHRINPQDIEEIVCEVESVIAAVAIGVDDALLGEAITLYIVSTDKTKEHERAILRYCREKLPLFKLPKKIQFIDSLPRSTTGKINRASLRGLN